MATKVHMEALSPTMEEGQLVRWLKQEGDAIQEGDVLAEIETDKATMELVARGSGVLQGVKLKEGQTAPVGEVIAMIAAEGEAVAESGGGAGTRQGGATAGGEGPAAPAAAAAPAAGEAQQAAPAETAQQGSEASGRPEDQEQLTPAAEATGAAATAEGAEPKEARQAQPKGGGQAGGAQAGVAQAGGGQTGGGQAGGQAAGAPAGGPPRARDQTGARADDRGNGRTEGRVRASPLARRLAAESGVELGSVSGTGPGGRITKRDIEAARQGPAPAEAAAPAAAVAAPEAERVAADAGAAPQRAAAAAPAAADMEQVPVSQMRKTIAKRLVQSIGPVPTFYLTIECDMTRMLELRERVNERLQKDGVRTSINDFLIKAVATALARHPEVNASWGEAAITRHHRVHIGVAVAVEDGLITPIVRDADRKRVRDIAVEVKELAGRARERKLKPEEYTGATFSLSNLGMFGIVEFTAIINPPEAGIIAIGGVEEKVAVEHGEMVVRPRMRMTMSCDHRVVDGAMGARFLQTVREMVEDPTAMIA